MKRQLALALILLFPQAALAQVDAIRIDDLWQAARESLHPTPPHPAVVRIIATEQDGASLGSGTLIARDDSSGLVITNWHVVREASTDPLVVFPDGFQSVGKIQKTDADWDLALLKIQRPKVAPVALSNQPPLPGDPLTIAGYGRGTYRAVTGSCTQYVSPGVRMPFEMVEVSVAARQGDSGGPILNSRGELAGVLFGAGWGRTSGSYCGRVRKFLEGPATVTPRSPPLERLPTVEGTLARQPKIDPHTYYDSTQRPPDQPAVARSTVAVPNGQSVPEAASSPELPREPLAIAQVPGRVPQTVSNDAAPEGAVAEIPNPPAVAPLPAPIARMVADEVDWEELLGRTWLDQAKTVLALFGLLTLMIGFLRREGE